MFEVEKPTLPFDAVKFELTEGKEGEVVRTRAGKINLTPEQETLGEEFARLLNRSIHHNGCWRVVFCNPQAHYYDKISGLFLIDVATRIELQWLDETGDPFFKVDIDDDPQTVLDVGISYYRDCCEEAYHKAREFIFDIVGVTKNQMFHQSKGEKPKGRYEDAPH